MPGLGGSGARSPSPASSKPTGSVVSCRPPSSDQPSWGLQAEGAFPLVVAARAPAAGRRRVSRALRQVAGAHSIRPWSPSHTASGLIREPRPFRIAAAISALAGDKTRCFCRVSAGLPSAGLIAAHDVLTEGVQSLIDEARWYVGGKAEGFVESSPRLAGRRLFAGWSANLVQMVLGITQQVALVPGFPAFWTGETLAAWLVVYAVGESCFHCGCGPAFPRSTAFSVSNRAPTAMAGPPGSTLRCCGSISGLVAALTLLLLAGAPVVLAPSAVLDLRAVPHFDAAFVVMATGMLWTVPSNLVAGALSRARALWTRGEGAECRRAGRTIRPTDRGCGRPGACWPSRLPLSPRNCLPRPGCWQIDAPRLFPYLRGPAPRIRGAGSSVNFARRHRSRWRRPPIWRCSICRCCWSVRLCPIAWPSRNGASRAWSRVCSVASASR